MFQAVSRLFRSHANRRHGSAAQRRRQFFQLSRRPKLERLEAREVLAATLHNIAAAYVDVVQNDTGNTEASVTITAPYSFNDFGFRSGSSRADYNIQIGPSAEDDVTGGILLTSISNNGRDNGEGNGIQYGITSVHDDGTNGYWIATHNTSQSGIAGGSEYNFNVSAAYFPYSDGWIGGLVRNSTRANGGANNTLIGSSQLAIGTHFFDLGGGQSTLDLRPLDINSQTDGVLIVNHGKNENNFGMSRANADGTWTMCSASPETGESRCVG